MKEMRIKMKNDRLTEETRQKICLLYTTCSIDF